MHHLPSLHIGSLSLAINLQDVLALRFILAGEFSYDPCSQVNHHAFWGWSNPPGVCVCVLQNGTPTANGARTSVPCAHYKSTFYHVCTVYRAPRTRDARPHGAPPRPLAAQLWWDRGVGWVGAMEPMLWWLVSTILLLILLIFTYFWLTVETLKWQKNIRWVLKGDIF